MNSNNNDLESRLNFALVNLEKNNLEKASNIYKKILKKYPNNFDANFNLGTILAKKNSTTHLIYEEFLTMSSLFITFFEILQMECMSICHLLEFLFFLLPI